MTEKKQDEKCVKAIKLSIPTITVVDFIEAVVIAFLIGLLITQVALTFWGWSPIHPP